MPVCQYFLRGACKFGNACKNEHPAKSGHSSNRFDSLGSNTFRGLNTTQDHTTNRDRPYQLDKGIVANDLGKERPLWILSAYGPGRNAPLQLFGGFPREQSFEELRLRHYDLAAVGNQQQAIQEAQSWVNSAEQQMQTALNDVDGAIRYIVDGENQHPNRHDVCKAAGSNLSQQAATSNQYTTMPGSSQITSSNFGGPSTTLGQPSAPVSTLGQSTSLGQPQSLFGQPNPISGQTPAFGQPSILGPPPGAPFGHSSSLNSAFNQPTAPAPFGSAQGGLSVMNGHPAPGNLTSRPSNPFDQPPLPAQSAPAPSSVFRQTSLPVNTNTLGQPRVPVTSTGFPQLSSTSGNAFINLATPSSNPFASSSTAQPSSSVTHLPVTTNSFGFPSTSATSGGFGQAVDAQRPNTSQPSAQRDAQGKLKTWKGKPVTYIDNDPCFKGDDGHWEKAWFPDGPPVLTKVKELPAEAYDKNVKESYKFLKEHGSFKDGILPDLPPRKEWCSWDF